MWFMLGKTLLKNNIKQTRPQLEEIHIRTIWYFFKKYSSTNYIIPSVQPV